MAENQTTQMVLLVDDEGSILKSLQRLFRKEGIPVQTAGSGSEALDCLRHHPDSIALIISDQRMPEMSGAQFLEQAKTLAPDAGRFLLTGYSDMEAVVSAVNKGEIHRYLTKPWNDEELIAAARQAMEHFRLIRENRCLQQVTQDQNRRLNEMNRVLEERVAERTAEVRAKNDALSRLNARLEESFMDAVRLVASLIDALSPQLGQVMRRTAELARVLAEDEGLDPEAVRQIETAALVHDVGLLGLPEPFRERTDVETGGVGGGKHRNHPLVAEALLAPIEKLQPAAEIVRHHHECVDGSGYPDGLKGDAIPFGARILAVAGDYCRGVYGRMDAKTAANGVLQTRAQQAVLRGAGSRYDRRAVGALLKYIERGSVPTSISGGGLGIPQWVEIGQLAEGMELTCDLRLKDGRLLLPRGARIKCSSIASLRRLFSHGLVDSKIPVRIGRAEPTFRINEGAFQEETGNGRN
jgi:response regulator RpfG family c-di-GMP phosphodiesterase